MHHFLPSLLGLTIALLIPLVHAGGSYYALCYCVNEKVQVVAKATNDACDAIDSSDYYDAEPPLFPTARCEGTEDHAINNNCFDCLCRRTKGLYGICDAKNPDPFKSKIKCGDGC